MRKATHKATGQKIPCLVSRHTDEWEILEALLDSNRSRAKTQEQIGREWNTWQEIFHAQNSRQGQRTDLAQAEPEAQVEPEPEPQEVAPNIPVESPDPEPTLSQPVSATSDNQLSEVAPRPSHQTAAKLGISQVTGNRASQVVNAVDDLRKQGRAEEAEVDENPAKPT